MLHPELKGLPFFQVGETELDWAIGLRGEWKPEFQDCGVRREEFTIDLVQQNYRGELCYRVIADSDTHKFGMPARVNEIMIYAE